MQPDECTSTHEHHQLKFTSKYSEGKIHSEISNVFIVKSPILVQNLNIEHKSQNSKSQSYPKLVELANL